MPSFVANRISANHNLLFPDRIDVDENKIVYYKGALIGYQTTIVHRTSISSVRLISNVFFADIIIESNGGRRLEINGLSKSDARTIYHMLQ